jgi:uncharacterized protein
MKSSGLIKIGKFFFLALFLLVFHHQGMAQDWQEKAIRFVIGFAENDIDGMHTEFSDQMQQELGKRQLSEIRNQIYTKLGDLETILDPDFSTTGEGEAYIFPLIFEYGNLGIKLNFNQSGDMIGFFFVPYELPNEYIFPPYFMPDLVDKMDIPLPGEYSLRGQLVKPKGMGPFPLVILIPGSGPQDMDLTLGPNKPFTDIAVGLAMQGIATYRFDKRTYSYPEAFKDNYTVDEEIVLDVIRAYKLMLNQAEVDKENIFLLGHSFGGMLSPRIAENLQDIRGVILMAANARPVEDMILEQIEYIYRYSGDEIDNPQLKQIKKMVENVKQLTPESTFQKHELPFSVPKEYWLDLKNYNPAQTLKKLKTPTLILQGGRDYQVTSKDFDLWEKSLRRKQKTSVQYSSLNHLFFEGEGPSLPEEYEVRGYVPLYVISDIAEWVSEKKVRK